MIDKRRTRDGEVRYEVRLRGTDGKERSRTFRTKKEAERYERTQQTAIEHGLWIDPRAGKVTLEAWAKEWQRTVVHLRASTQRIYGANLRNHIVPELGQVELAKLTPSMLRAWLSGLTTKVGRHGEPLAPGSVAQAYRTLNRVLVAAMDDELLGRNPLSGVKPPRVVAEPMRFLSHDEVATLAATIDPRYRAFVLVAAYTGLRAGELIGLRRKHVDPAPDHHHRRASAVHRRASRGPRAEDRGGPAVRRRAGDRRGRSRRSPGCQRRARSRWPRLPGAS